ncbi:MAG: arsenate reductase ArsC [Bacteroidales bacterium]|nr:arsenate reductase ArsC [Bacteroidales bacterium]
MGKTKVLFICIHNSARSQMAEALLNHLAGEKFEAQSAGLEEGTLNPFAIAVMHEIGIDISGNKSKSVFDFFKRGEIFNYAITVCDEGNSERCPIFPGVTHRILWSILDPSIFTGTHEEKLDKTRKVRDEIKANIEQFILTN